MPDSRIEFWPGLMKEIRAGSGGRVVVLNHPRDVHSGFKSVRRGELPLLCGRIEDRRGVPYSSSRRRGDQLGRDAIRPMRLLRDWFAALEPRPEVTAVGAESDSHDVSRFIVQPGSAPTSSAGTRPGRIDIAEACRSLREGHALVKPGAAGSSDDRRQVPGGRPGHEKPATRSASGLSWSDPRGRGPTASSFSPTGSRSRSVSSRARTRRARSRGSGGPCPRPAHVARWWPSRRGRA